MTISLYVGVEPCVRYSSQWWDSTWLGLHKSSACCYNCCEFMYVAVLLCPENTAALWSSTASGSYIGHLLSSLERNIVNMIHLQAKFLPFYECMWIYFRMLQQQQVSIWFFWSLQCYLSFPVLSSFYPPTPQFMPSISIISSSKPLYQWILSSFPWIYLHFLWFLSNFLTFMNIPEEIHTFTDSKLVSTNERNEWLFFWDWAISLRKIVFISLLANFMILIFHNSQVIFHCVNTLNFHYPFISWWVSKTFPSSDYYEQSSNEHKYAWSSI